MVPPDCTDFNADFVLRRLLKTNPAVVLRDPTRPRNFATLVPHRLMYDDQDKTIYEEEGSHTIDIPWVLGYVSAFWLGRILTHCCSVHPNRKYVVKFLRRNAPSKTVDLTAIRCNLYRPFFFEDKDLVYTQWVVLGGSYKARGVCELSKNSLRWDVRLNLSHTRLDDPGAAWLANHITRTPFPKLHELNLRDTVLSETLGSMGCDPEPMGMILTVFEGGIDTSELRGLDLGNNNLRSYVKAMATTFKEDSFAPKLQFIGLSNANLDDEAMGVLCEAMGRRRRLEQLDLSANCFGDEGLSAFMRQGWQFTRLVVLFITNVHVSVGKWLDFAIWVAEWSNWLRITDVYIGKPDDDEFSASCGRAIELMKEAINVKKAMGAWIAKKRVACSGQSTTST